MTTARDVIAKALRTHARGVDSVLDTEYRRDADAVLAALREHWTRDETVRRVWEAVSDNAYSGGDAVRTVIAALLDGGETP